MSRKPDLHMSARDDLGSEQNGDNRQENFSQIISYEIQGRRRKVIVLRQ
jgi:hypothetical protein